ncbi:tripartite tricarboxylate transporter substrate-binding protein [Natronolimnohabitans sp. A-GB9]|uniref:Bug family tripartite tricarboxylate transporter substrate binding protein n=1 Tax=Natronolimnohabitans sp. A-GB9 TaxID=3069757 RepID=UPI0027B48334|nr:tripartite tricarboxylate transporter substrate-binding protein [Natronolimnohabitans sp. A-GB9]MDQ2049563.1 tripartite tricarboxylate transporter substrate-binding protein [Natronolimnohabitans sp. A-GB9]
MGYETTSRRDVLKVGAVGAAGISIYGGEVLGVVDLFDEQHITVIVPWAQGGGTDRAIRVTTPTWSDLQGIDFVVENYPGGSTQVGGEQVYNAEPDGTTIAMWNLPQMQATWLFQDAPYRTEDFDYIGTHHWDPTMWFAPPDRPYDDLEEFIEYAREEGATVGITAAIGNTALSALLVDETYDLDLSIVNMEGGSGVRQAVLAGDIDAGVNQPWAFDPDHADDVTALGSHTPDQQELWPTAPAFGELGLDEIPLVEEGLGQWKLIVAPGGLRDRYPDRFEELAESYAAVFEDDEFQTRIEEQGGLDEIADYRGPEETEQEVEENAQFMETYADVIENFIYDQ